MSMYCDNIMSWNRPAALQSLAAEGCSVKFFSEVKNVGHFRLLSAFSQTGQLSAKICPLGWADIMEFHDLSLMAGFGDRQIYIELAPHSLLRDSGPISCITSEKRWPGL